MFILITVLLLTTVVFFISESGSNIQFDTSTNASNELQAYYAAKQAEAKQFNDCRELQRLERAIDRTQLHIVCLSKWHNNSKDAELAQLQSELVSLVMRVQKLSN